MARHEDGKCYSLNLEFFYHGLKKPCKDCQDFVLSKQEDAAEDYGECQLWDKCSKFYYLAKQTCMVNKQIIIISQEKLTESFDLGCIRCIREICDNSDEVLLIDNGLCVKLKDETACPKPLSPKVSLKYGKEATVFLICCFTLCT